MAEWVKDQVDTCNGGHLSVAEMLASYRLIHKDPITPQVFKRLASQALPSVQFVEKKFRKRNVFLNVGWAEGAED